MLAADVDRAEDCADGEERDGRHGVAAAREVAQGEEEAAEDYGVEYGADGVEGGAAAAAGVVGEVAAAQEEADDAEGDVDDE